MTIYLLFFLICHQLLNELDDMFRYLLGALEREMLYGFVRVAFDSRVTEHFSFSVKLSGKEDLLCGVY